MGCEPIVIDGMVLGIACSRGKRRRRVACDEPGCSQEHEFLCDHKLKGRKTGQTCDRKVCRGHATEVGEDRHICPAHARQQQLELG